MTADAWQQELKRQAIDDVADLADRWHLSDAQVAQARRAARSFPFFTTRYYADLADPRDPDCPIRRQILPTENECVVVPGEREDPLGEEDDAPVAGLTHRYPDRALLLVTLRCFSYCRHCNRRRKVGGAVDWDALERAVAVIAQRPQIRDVLLSGGDPLWLTDQVLDAVLTRVRAIPHVRTVRLGTRAPVVFPPRITPELVAVLRRHHPLWVNTHFNHPKELTPQAAAALALLVDAGIPVGNQTVLLRGINDDPETMRALCEALVEHRVRPYYLFQCDLAPGLSHFRTTVGKGLEIMEHLVGHLRGYAVPTYAVDTPDGGGKIPLLPQYLLVHGDGRLVFRNYEGMIVAYDEPGRSGGAQDGPVHSVADVVDRGASLLPASARVARRKGEP